MKYTIVLDASADITPELVAKYEIKFIPMEYSLGDTMRTCKGLEDASILTKFYAGQANGDLTKTTQITPYIYEQEFSKYLEEGSSVLYLALSSGLSSTYASSLIASTNLKEKYPNNDVVCVDTLSATAGIGLLAEIAGKNRDKGLDIFANKEDIINNLYNVQHFFMVEDLMYLKRGGRVSPSVALVGAVLNIKPILSIDKEGKLPVIAKRHGKKLSVSYLVECLKENANELTEAICIGDAGSIEGRLELKAKVQEAFPNTEIREFTLSPIIGAHTGPGMLFVAYIGKRR